MTNKELLDIIKQADPDAEVELNIMVGDHELAPVVHAKWIDGEYDEHYKPVYMCSNCRSCYMNRLRFCGTCGARMDGE